MSWDSVSSNLEAAKAVPLGLCAVGIVGRETFNQSKIRKEIPETAQLCGCNKFWATVGLPCPVTAGGRCDGAGKGSGKPHELMSKWINWCLNPREKKPPPWGVWNEPWVLWAWPREVRHPQQAGAELWSCWHSSGYWHLCRRWRTALAELGQFGLSPGSLWFLVGDIIMLPQWCLCSVSAASAQSPWTMKGSPSLGSWSVEHLLHKLSKASAWCCWEDRGMVLWCLSSFFLFIFHWGKKHNPTE